MDFVVFLFKLEGFIPALVSYIATILSFVFSKYFPLFPPEIWQGALSLLSIILTAFVSYNAHPAYQAFKARRR